MPLSILADNHHGDLWHSFHLLFQQRLGYDLYMPIGLDWFEQGYWDYGFHDAAVAGQYLGPQRIVENKGTHVLVYDHRHNLYHKGLTLEQFRAMDIDVLLSTMPQTDIGFDKAQKEIKPKAKRVTQIGNAAQYTNTPNVMLSAIPILQKHRNYIIYHQEFDLDTFSFCEPSEEKMVRCFINVLPNLEVPWKLYQMYRSLSVNYGFQFQSYGIACPDGQAESIYQMSSMMRGSMWGWQVKAHGDGYGHVAHNWGAVGRPVLTNLSYYKDKMAGRFYIDNVTCVDVDAPRAFERFLEFSKPDAHRAMCHAMRNRFREVVDFAEDALLVRRFMETLE